MFSRDKRYGIGAVRHITAGNRVNDALAALMGRRYVSTAARLAVHNAALVPMLILLKKNERKMNAMEMRFFRKICGVSLSGRIRNEEIHRMAGTSDDIMVRIKRNVLSWFGYIERMSV